MPRDVVTSEGAPQYQLHVSWSQPGACLQVQIGEIVEIPATVSQPAHTEFQAGPAIQLTRTSANALVRYIRRGRNSVWESDE